MNPTLMPKFGNITNPSIDILTEIKTIGELGFDFVEIGQEEPLGIYDLLIRKRRQILQLLKKYNLFTIGHVPWWAELGTNYKEVRRAWIRESKDMIVLARKLEIEKLNFHTHSRGMVLRVEKYRKKVLDNYVSSLRELVKFGKKYNVRIILENPVEKGEITNLKDFKYIVDRVRGLRCTLDVGHGFVIGGIKYVKNLIKLFEDRLEHVHMSDNHGESDEHLPIGRGSINFPLVVKMLKKIDYDKTITFEIFSKNRKDAKNSMNKIKKMWRYV